MMGVTERKQYNIDKQTVMKAYRLVKANAGSAGVDKVSLEAFEKSLKGNLYKVWNRMSSGSYFPPAVRAVPIPKKNGGQRILGVPTVADRVAQTVVKLQIEQALEEILLPDSYGYRPGKSALDAVGVTRQRCWKMDWVLEFDIKGLFDNISHKLLMKGYQEACARRMGSALHRTLANSDDARQRRSDHRSRPGHTPRRRDQSRPCQFVLASCVRYKRRNRLGTESRPSWMDAVLRQIWAVRNAQPVSIR
ncbi:reverse transcriptase domain-containing protein [Bradyrhizobium brasilense]|uniref:reverse transcriptase domain-containing protein n=1 Tax=Bradyrhizobium brasilense TaxID=1419277 RepID=UPI0035C71514